MDEIYKALGDKPWKSWRFWLRLARLMELKAESPKRQRKNILRGEK